MAYTYQNTSDNTLTLVNIGEVEPGKTIKSAERLHHPDLKQVPGTKRTTAEKPATSTKAGEKEAEK